MVGHVFQLEKHLHVSVLLVGLVLLVLNMMYVVHLHVKMVVHVFQFQLIHFICVNVFNNLLEIFVNIVLVQALSV